ncbi:hypothetical protein PX554_16330 [Sphingomonas sp. H39-1-10]|uniref:hypothetical protein n=1 Tax=Sphingomonas TaxID=13687 RepID=UPI00087EC2F3|nr:MULTISPECIES: hypothetical protein [Sphingomonas]MDF0489702.1 hypothetical protein [Sphingomonas pollutisoli]SDA31126.1 hypothetical protein SAMN03159340_02565 [Sphingomonas sp. NFR15]
MAHADPIVARDQHIRSAILGVIVLYAAIVLMVTDRPVVIGSRALVLPGASIPVSAAPKGYVEALDQYGVHLPKQGHAPALAERAPLTVERLRFGYSIVETSILGAPYWYRKDDGYVVYYETLREYVYAPVTDDYMRKVGLPGPKPLSRQSFAWWEHVWGWVFPLALAGWGLFEIGAARRRREAEGLI